MSGTQRGGLKAAFSNFRKNDEEAVAERRLLGREAEPSEQEASPQASGSYAVASSQVAAADAGPGLRPRPLLQREPVRQMSFRCPLSLSNELRRKAAFNQLEQQETIMEGIRRVLAELPAPPDGWADA